jgi:hypothetical protein
MVGRHGGKCIKPYHGHGLVASLKTSECPEPGILELTHFCFLSRCFEEPRLLLSPLSNTYVSYFLFVRVGDYIN